jgi:CubicO group peptidase (beta-lactamase class C family)
MPRAELDAEAIDAAPLAAAWSAARAQGARALLVVRHGHLVFERYAEVADSQARFDGGPMSATVLALLAGVVRAGQPGAPTDAPASDIAALQATILRAGQGSVEDILSRQLWRSLDADTAWYLPAPDGAARADCCLQARAVDWLRVGLLLLEHGRDRGEQRVPAEWVEHMLQPVAGDPTRGLAVRLAPRGYAVRNIVWLPGSGSTRLWLSPALQLAVLRVDNASASSTAAGLDGGGGADWLDPLLRAVRDRSQAQDAGDFLDQLVPGH